MFSRNTSDTVISTGRLFLMTMMRLADGDFAIGEGVERIDQLVGAHAGGRFDFDLDFLGGEIVDRS